MLKNPKYSKEILGDGRPLYRRDGKRIKKASIPKEELVKLSQTDSEQEDQIEGEIIDAVSDVSGMVEPEPLQSLQKTCLMCGEPATRQRFVNLQLVEVCDKDYFETSLGKLVIALREKGQYEPVSSNQQASGSSD